jgi:hypothetical protein
VKFKLLTAPFYLEVANYSFCDYPSEGSILTKATNEGCRQTNKVSLAVETAATKTKPAEAG